MVAGNRRRRREKKKLVGVRSLVTLSRRLDVVRHPRGHLARLSLAWWRRRDVRVWVVADVVPGTGRTTHSRVLGVREVSRVEGCRSLVERSVVPTLKD